MDGDIDIEEHDVFDNPAIKNIFPDISALKKEISVYNDEALITKQDADVISIDSIELIAEDEDCENGSDSVEELTRIDKAVDLKKEIQSPTKTPFQEQEHLFNNKIILGSRPSQEIKFDQIKYKHYEQHIKPFLAKVCLNDVTSYLADSHRFCSLCQILFPQKEDLASHNIACHCIDRSNQKPKRSKVEFAIQDKSKCRKRNSNFGSSGSLKTHMRNNNKQEIRTCFHCQKSFNSHKSLIEHVYKVLQSSKLTATTQIKLTESKTKLKTLLKRKQKSNQTDKNVNLKNHGDVRTEKKIRPQQSSNYMGQDKSFFYKCCYCSYYFRDKNVFLFHLMNKHKDKDATNVNKVKYDSNCKFCSAHCKTFDLYNAHLHQVHKGKINNNFKIQPTLCLTKVELLLAGKSNSTIVKENGSNRSNDNQIRKEIYCSRVENNCLDIVSNVPIRDADYKPKSNKFKALDNISAESKYTEPEKTSQKKNKRIKITDSSKFNKEIENDDEYFDDVGGDSDFSEEDYIEQSQRKSKRLKRTNLSTSYKETEHDEYLEDISSDLTKPVHDNTLVLKGILFKCKKCDIHFLSAISAINHLEHMEMLINWKCLTCQKIFKKRDDFLHNKQHSFSNEFTVYELSEAEFSRVLYKCSKCAIHFNHDKYASHFKVCGSTIPESAYCITCDILLENSIMPGHEREHKTTELTSTDFTVITSDTIINYNTDQANKTIVVKKTERQFYHKNKVRDSLILKYCDTCKCCISYINVKSVHVEGGCGHMSKIACTDCGVVTTCQSLNRHRNIHKIKKNLKLQDFTFYELKTNKQILPPIPDYPKCNSCDVRFLNKRAIANHICNENEFLTCPVCDLKLCDKAFKLLHVDFHNYVMKKGKSNASKKNSEAIKEQSVSDKFSRNEEIRKGYRKSEEELNSDTIEDVPNEVEQNSSVDPVKDVVDTVEDIDAFNYKQKSNIDHDKKDVGKHQNVKVTCNQAPNTNPLQDNSNSLSIEERNSLSSVTVLEKEKSVTKTTEIPIKQVSDFELFTVIYCCVYCYVTVDTYDKAVEHCQDHYSDVDIKINIEKCTHCKMKYDRRFYSDHKVLHKTRKSNKTLKILKFDAVHFAVDYRSWSNNLFESLEPGIAQSILDRSLYKYEGRVRLQVIQEGQMKLTVYKCNVCRMFVDPDTILIHAESSCFRLRKHPCVFCGIPFISHVSRMSHQADHQNTTCHSIKSLKIVAFNQGNDDMECNKRILRSRNNFDFFQCRNCDALFERFQCRTHECNPRNLKSCLICGFLLYNTDYKPHILKHKLLINFINHNRNVKIIRFGLTNKNNSGSDNLKVTPSKFIGNVIDYTFYKCTKCAVYIKNTQISTFKHNCFDKDSQIICSQCCLTFLKKHINQHHKLHDGDPYFVKDNFNLIPYKDSFVNELENLVEKEKEEIVEDCDQQNGSVVAGTSTKSEITVIKSSPNEKSTTNNFSKVISERVEKIYKCNCGLHFLDKLSIDSHFGHCNTRISKQTCSKCCLLFTPKDLFTHLLKHHQDKKFIYTLNVIQMSKDKNKVIDLYKCSVCNLHFGECEKAKEHFGHCLNSISDGKKCEKCELLFDMSAIDTHKASHHNDDVADFEIKLTNDSIYTNEGNTLENNIQNLTAQADAVIDSSYEISEETLSQINLNSYSNIIYKCVQCELHFITEHTYKRHISVKVGCKYRQEAFTPATKNCNVCGLNFTLQSLSKHLYIHHKQMKLELPDIVIKTSLSQDND